VLLLRKSGRADLDRVRKAVARDGIRAIRLETPGIAPVIGGILLVFPGFITDILGAALYVPALRRWAAGKLATSARRDGRRRGARHRPRPGRGPPPSGAGAPPPQAQRRGRTRSVTSLSGWGPCVSHAAITVAENGER